VIIKYCQIEMLYVETLVVPVKIEVQMYCSTDSSQTPGW